jgi:3-oxoacyl-[acyl-carrier-protein] synthase-3
MSNNPLRAAITGIGGYVPDYVLTNEELSTIVDTNDEWIVTRTGIKERRILKGEGAGVTIMAEQAVKQLLEKTDTDPKSIDAVIFATVTPDMVFPASAVILANKVGITNAFGYDVQSACSSFLYSLYTGAMFIESGRCKKVLVVGGDKMTAITNYADRTTCVLFGDGAGAVLLEPSLEFGIQDAILRSDGMGVKYLFQKSGGSMYPPSIETVTNREHFVFQEGKSVFKFAVTKMADVSYEMMQKHNLESEDIAYLLPHQANKRIIDATAERMGLDESKVLMNIQRYGNTTSATIPLLMHDFEHKFKAGDNLMLAAFGGGFTWGSIWLKWAYDGEKVSRSAYKNE